MSIYRRSQIMPKTTPQNITKTRWLNAAMITLALLAYATFSNSLIASRSIQSKSIVCQKSTDYVRTSEGLSVICQTLSE